MRDDAKLSLFTVGNLQTDVVLRISPIDADEGRKFSVCLWRHDLAPEVLQ